MGTGGGLREQFCAMLQREASPIVIDNVRVFAQIEIQLTIGVGFTDQDQQLWESKEFVDVEDDDKVKANGGNQRVSCCEGDALRRVQGSL